MAWPKGRPRKAEPAAAPAEPGNPSAVRLTQTFAYWTDDGLLRRWPAGCTEEDPAEIADLVNRQAPIEVL